MGDSFKNEEFADRISDKLDYNNVQDFDSFKEELDKAFDSTRGNNAKFEESDYLYLFENKAVKNKLKEILPPEEIDKLYGDGELVQREIEKTPVLKKEKVITITTPKVSVRAYRGTKSYSRGKAMKWTDEQTKFLKLRKKAGKLSVSEVVYQFNERYRTSQRTKSSISTKFYRLK